jgi:hypothetical protein
MTVILACGLEPEAIALAASTAEWVRAFYPDVSVNRQGDTAMLSSESRSEDGLRLIWRTSLVNEKLLAAGAIARAGVLEALVR